MGWRGTAPARRDGQRQIPFALKDEPMDTLVTMALVGTAQQPDKNIGTGTPIDTLTAGFSRREMERRILLAGGYALPAGAEITWQEGTPEQRSEILRRLRASDPAKARQWLEGTWKLEKVQFRAEALETFSTGLSADDESFLEEALNDRSAKVCETAASLLVRIPISALAARMRSRANEMLVYAKGKLTVTPPTAIDKQWQRDGIVARAPQGVGERAWWLMQVMERIPPAHWEEHFAAPPAKLIASVRPKEWEQTLIEGWSQAAIRFNDAQWILALWDWWYQRRYYACPEQLRRDLINLMPQQEAESRVQEQLINYKSPKNAGWEDLLSALPTPWSKEFGDVYLAELRNYLGKIAVEVQNSYRWLTSVTIATTALPPACFAAALEKWTLPESSNAHTRWHIQRWHEQINTFTEALRIHQRLIEEIA